MRDKLEFARKVKPNQKSADRKFRDGNIRRLLESSVRQSIAGFT